MRLHPIFQAFLALLLVTLVWICDVSVAEIKQEREEAAQAILGRERISQHLQDIAFDSGFWEGARAATSAMSFSASNGQWTAETNFLCEALRQARYNHAHARLLYGSRYGPRPSSEH
jgi:hypothetical protein